MLMAPLTLVETSPGSFSLLFRDLDSASGAFVAAGHSGNGYSWQALARHMLESALSDVEARIELDSEADMFCAHSDDPEALTRLGKLLAEAAGNPSRLAKLIATVPSTLWDD
jgi:hypothetical protein